jgi:hypothetical protein
MSSSTATVTLSVPLKLNFVIRFRANVLGKLVKPKFYKRIECSVTYNPKKLNVAISFVEDKFHSIRSKEEIDI